MDDNQKKKLDFFKNRPIYIFLAVMIIFVFLFYYLKIVRKTSYPSYTPFVTPLITKTQVEVSPTKESVEQKQEQFTQRESFLLTTKGEKTYQLGDEVEVLLKADSNKRLVSGFDILISYDNQTLEFLNAEILDSSFDFFKMTQPGFVVLTGVRKLNKELSYFDNKELIVLKFRALKKGKTEIGILKEKNKEVTQFIDEKSQKFYPIVNELDIEIL